jgi:hypothetical protein
MTGSHCRGLRKRLGVPQGTLAFAVGIERPRLSLFENGPGTLRPEEIERIAAYLAKEMAEVKRIEFPEAVGA